MVECSSFSQSFSQRERESEKDRESEKEGQSKKEGEREKERNIKICRIWLLYFFKEMTGALAPFSYLVQKYHLISSCLLRFQPRCRFTTFFANNLWSIAQHEGAMTFNWTAFRGTTLLATLSVLICIQLRMPHVLYRCASCHFGKCQSAFFISFSFGWMSFYRRSFCWMSFCWLLLREWQLAECNSDKCNGAEFSYAGCQWAKFDFLNCIQLNVILLIISFF